MPPPPISGRKFFICRNRSLCEFAFMKVWQRVCVAALCLAVLCLAAVAGARAEYIVSVGNLSLDPGQSGYVPVYISSTSSDPLAFEYFQFGITSSGPTQLQFANSPAPVADPTFGNPEYVFFGNSGDLNAAAPLGFAGTTTVPNDTFNGGDNTANGANVLVPMTNVLLAELPVTANTSLPPVIGDTFSISLIPQAGASSTAGTTGFSDNTQNFASSFLSTPGTVSIVPEPSSLVLAFSGLAAIAGLRFRKRQSATATKLSWQRGHRKARATT